MVSSWRQIQRKNFTSLELLADFLHWDARCKEAVLQKSNFPLNFPWRLAAKVTKNCLDDPILKQFLPSLEELVPDPSFSLAPVQDALFQKGSSKKLLHKYQGRALLLVSGACAMHCRYCFRRNYEYERVY